MADEKKSAIYNSKGQIVGYSEGGRKATDLVTSDEELAEKVAKQKEAQKEKPKQGLGALAAALKKATPTPTPTATPKK